MAQGHQEQYHTVSKSSSRTTQSYCEKSPRKASKLSLLHNRRPMTLSSTPMPSSPRPFSRTIAARGQTGAKQVNGFTACGLGARHMPLLFDESLDGRTGSIHM